MRASRDRAPGLLLNSAWELVGGLAAALGGEPAGDVRRWRDSCEVLAVVVRAPDPGPVITRFGELPQIVSLIEQAEWRAVGVTVDGVPVEIVVADPARFGTALVRATGSPAYVEALEPLPGRLRGGRGLPRPGHPLVSAGAARRALSWGAAAAGRAEGHPR